MSERRRSPRPLVAAVVAAALLVVPAAVVAAPASSEEGSARGALSARASTPVTAEEHGDHDHSIASLNAHGVDTSVQTGARAADEGVAPSVSEVPSGFQDLVAIGGISEPTGVAFAPDGTAFVALKTGVIKSWDYNSGTGSFESNATHVNFANLDVNVNNYWDRGLTGIAVDPQFGTAGHNFVYVNYAYNRDPRDASPIVPKWGTPGQQYDECPNPASMGPPVVPGCLINIRVSRLAAVQGANGWVMSGAEQPLIEGACMQFPSHASGDVAIGPDGTLYASAGDGASFDTEDYGQGGDPCPGDPDNEGGSLRSQDIRTSGAGDPLSISGSIFRISNPATAGAINGTDVNPDRIVAYGQRNPWRLTFRPGTSELWSGDVGGSIWEEINRIDVGSFTTAANRGWPCYEGSFTGVQKQPAWDALNRPICENLYTAEAATPGTVKAPYFSYRTRGGGLLTPGENCQQGTSSISGVAFVPSTSSYPTAYRGSLFFNDYARGCIWRLGKLGNGDPDPNSISPFVEAADTPVAVEIGPGGDLFYVDYGIVDGVPTGGAGDIHRIVYTPSNQAPVAAVSANPTSGAAPLSVNFSAAGSTDADPGDVLSYAWDLDGDTQFDDATGVTTSRTYSSPGNVTVTVRVSDGEATDTDSVVISPGNSAPTLTSVSPPDNQTWRVGQVINFAATATDAQQTLTDANYTWSLSIAHCPSVCHTHPVQTWVGERTGSFTAPDHEYPSRLLLSVTVTDNQGLADTDTINAPNGLEPQSVGLNFASVPTGASLTVAGADHTAPYSQTFIVGSNFGVTAPATRVISGANWNFASWSDGGTQSHSIVAPTSTTTYTATYTRVNRPPTATASANPISGTVPFTSNLSGSATDPDGDNTGFTYAWDLDNDGQFDDDFDANASRTFTQAGSYVITVRATDSHGGTDTDAKTITANPAAANQPPTAAISTTPSPATGPAPLSVGFSASGSSDPDSDPLSYAWDLDNDGAYDDDFDASASRTYGVGSHVVRVQVSDGRGGTDTEQVTVTSTNTAPVARITTTPTTPTGPAPFAVSFSASTSTDANGHGLSYAWDLDNDGAYDDATGVTASRTFPVGSHLVKVQASDGFAGGTDTEQVTVTSTNTAPVAAIAATPSAPGPAPRSVSFSAAGSTDANGHTLTYAWDLDNDGAFDDATGVTASRTYGVGSHVVRVQASDGFAGTDTEQVTVTATNQAPTAAITTTPNPPAGPAPLSVSFNAGGSTDPNAHTLTYAWDLDDDGQFDDATGATASRTYPFGNHEVTVRATDPFGLTDNASVMVSSGNNAPVLNSVLPAPSLTWNVGQTVNFSANATDTDQALVDADFAWELEKVLCDSGCDPQPVNDWTGRTGSFVAPDLPYPSHLLLTVTVSDNQGVQDSETLRLDPKTVDIRVVTTPFGMDIDLAPRSVDTPHTRTVIVGSRITLTAPKKQWNGPRRYQFKSWSDGGARTHTITAPAADKTYRAKYSAVRKKLVISTRPNGMAFEVDGERRAPGWQRAFPVGSTVEIGAFVRLRHAGLHYEFVRWSDGGGRHHTVTIPNQQLELKAIYRHVPARAPRRADWL